MEPSGHYGPRGLYRIAYDQKAVILYVTVNLLVYVFVVTIQLFLQAEAMRGPPRNPPGATARPTQFLLPTEATLGASIVVSVVSVGMLVIGTYFVFDLTTKLYGTPLGVFLGFLTFIPCLGLFILLTINGKATAVLKAQGIRVGLLGADMSAFAGEKGKLAAGGSQSDSRGTGQPRVPERATYSELADQTAIDPFERSAIDDAQLCYLCGKRLKAEEIRSRVCRVCQTS